jgi:hypothetical protein
MAATVWRPRPLWVKTLSRTPAARARDDVYDMFICISCSAFSSAVGGPEFDAMFAPFPGFGPVKGADAKYTIV